MKRVIFFALMALCLPLTFVSCSDDDEKQANVLVAGEYVTTLSDQVGQMFYHADLKRWYIKFLTERTIDEYLMFFPEQVPDELCKENIAVLFSGDVYEMEGNFTLPAGYRPYIVKLTYIAQSKGWD